jgi:uncharacterized protein
MLDRKGILSFLGITYAITYAVEIPMVLAGYRFDLGAQPVAQIAVAVLMWAPALATFLTMRFVTHEKRDLLNLRLGAVKPYLVVALLLPLLFIAVYGLTGLLGLGQPDWGLMGFQKMLAAVANGRPMQAMPSPWVIWPGLYLAALITAPFFNTLFALGEEIGWRGYLLPKLIPLGKPRAYLMLGLVWSAWHWPLIVGGFNYGRNNPFLGILAFTVVTTGLGIYLSELTLRYRSSVLAGWGHGVFNSQRLGVWGILFPGANPLLGGWTGLIGALTWLALGLWQLRQGTHETAFRKREGEKR